MFDIIKFLLSKDFWSNIKDIMSIIKSSDSWKNDIKRYKGRFSKDELFMAEIFIESCIKIINEKQWDVDEIEEIRIVSAELLQNCFTHGFKLHEREKIILKAMMTSSIIKIDFIDFGLDFLLFEEIERQKSSYDRSEGSHGLYLIQKMAIQLLQKKERNKNTISFVKTRGVKTAKIEKANTTIYLITIYSLNEIHSKMFWEWATTLISNSKKIIIDLQNAKFISQTVREGSQKLRSLSEFAEKGIAIVAKTDPFIIEFFWGFRIFSDIQSAKLFLESGIDLNEAYLSDLRVIAQPDQNDNDLPASDQNSNDLPPPPKELNIII